MIIIDRDRQRKYDKNQKSAREQKYRFKERRREKKIEFNNKK